MIDWSLVPTDGQTHHVVVTYGDGEPKVYVDGARV